MSSNDGVMEKDQQARRTQRIMYKVTIDRGSAGLDQGALRWSSALGTSRESSGCCCVGQMLDSHPLEAYLG